VRFLIHSRMQASCSAGSSNVRAFGKMSAWSDTASQGTTRMTCSSGGRSAHAAQRAAQPAHQPVLARLCAARAAPEWQWTAEPDTVHVLV